MGHQIEGRGVRDPRVLEAMRKVPREAFVPEDLRARAWEDGPLPIGEGQTISQPYIVALMTEAAGAGPGCRVLEVGTGSGYQAAVLAAAGAEVWTVERLPSLAAEARGRLEGLGGHVHVRVGDGKEGWPEEAPFDAIVVTAAAAAVPEALLAQLKDGGRLVIPLGPKGDQRLLRIFRDGREESLGAVRFVPLV